MEQDLFEKYLNKTDCKYIKIALTDASYNNRSKGVKKCDSNYEEAHKALPTNCNLATIGDALMKLVYAQYFFEDPSVDKLSKAIEPYITDKYLATVVAKHYDILKHLKYDRNDKAKKHDYIYEDKLKTSGKNRKKNPSKYIATAVEAIIGAIYMETKDINIIKEILTNDWKKFNN